MFIQLSFNITRDNLCSSDVHYDTHTHNDIHHFAIKRIVASLNMRLAKSSMAHKRFKPFFFFLTCTRSSYLIVKHPLSLFNFTATIAIFIHERLDIVIVSEWVDINFLNFCMHLKINSISCA